MENRIQLLEKKAKRVDINYKNVVINLNKIKKLESEVKKVERSKVIQQPKIEKQSECCSCNKKLKLLEKRLGELELENKNKEIKRSMNEEISLETLQDENNRFKSDIRELNSKLSKFKSEVIPHINGIISRKNFKEQKKRFKSRK